MRPLAAQVLSSEARRKGPATVRPPPRTERLTPHPALAAPRRTLPAARTRLEKRARPTSSASLPSIRVRTTSALRRLAPQRKRAARRRALRLTVRQARRSMTPARPRAPTLTPPPRARPLRRTISASRRLTARTQKSALRVRPRAKARMSPATAMRQRRQAATHALLRRTSTQQRTPRAKAPRPAPKLALMRRSTQSNRSKKLRTPNNRPKPKKPASRTLRRIPTFLLNPTWIQAEQSNLTRSTRRSRRRTRLSASRVRWKSDAPRTATASDWRAPRRSPSQSTRPASQKRTRERTFAHTSKEMRMRQPTRKRTPPFLMTATRSPTHQRIPT